MDDIKKALTLLSESNNRLTGAEQLIYSKPNTKNTKSESWIKPYIMLVESEMAERVVPGEETPPGVNRLTGKTNIAPPAEAPVQQPTSTVSKYTPGVNMPAPYVIEYKGKQYKFAGRDQSGPGTGEVIIVGAGAIGIRGLRPTMIELGQDGMYYVGKSVDEGMDTIHPKSPVDEGDEQ
jgi:hypothetical protein